MGKVLSALTPLMEVAAATVTLVAHCLDMISIDLDMNKLVLSLLDLLLDVRVEPPLVSLKSPSTDLGSQALLELNWNRLLYNSVMNFANSTTVTKIVLVLGSDNKHITFLKVK